MIRGRQAARQTRRDERQLDLRSVTQFTGLWRERACLYDNLTVRFQANRSYLILMAPEAQPSAFLRLLGGHNRPSRGKIVRTGSVSPLIGTGALPAYSHSVRDAVKLVAQLYGTDSEELLERVRLFIGDQDIRQDLLELSLQARTCLSFGLGYSVPADFYLVNALAPPASRSTPLVVRRCLEAFEARRRGASTITVASTTRNAAALADVAGVLHEGRLRMFDSVADAVLDYEQRVIHVTQPILVRVRSMVQRGLVDDARAFLSASGSIAELEGISADDLAEAHLAAGNIEEALQLARQAQENRPDALASNLLLARVADRAGVHHLAASSALVVVRADSGHMVGRQILARNLERLSRFDEAAEVWRTLAGSDSGTSLRSLIRCQMKAGDHEGALASIERAGRDHRDDKALVLARFECVLRVGTEADIVPSFKRVLFIGGDEAIAALRRHLGRVPARLLPGLADMAASSSLTRSSGPPLDFIVRHLRSGRFGTGDEASVAEAARVADRLEAARDGLLDPVADEEADA